MWVYFLKDARKFWKWSSYHVFRASLIVGNSCMYIIARMPLIEHFNCLENQPVRPMKRCSTASSVAQGVSHAVCPGVLRPCGRAQVERAGETSAARSHPFSFGNLSPWFRVGKPWVVSPSEPSKCLQLFEAKQTASNPSWLAAIHARTAMMRISHVSERLR